ncbi:MAG TPA: hypothetical protein VG253_05580 [Streptosporangiaceae bacterium]|nr:hypothetical protein [Streptosporangiaceae bacterium]
MLISSHVLAEVAQTVDRVLIISGGPLVLSPSLVELTPPCWRRDPIPRS